MKIKMSSLKRLIRDTISEISTPGDNRYDAYQPGTARGGHSGVGGAYRKPSFKDFDDETPTNYIDLDGNIHSSRDDMDDANYRIRNRQGLSGPGGSYVQGVGWVPGGDQEAGEMADELVDGKSSAEIEAEKDGGNRNPKEFLIVIDSPIIRGKGGKIEAHNAKPQKKSFTVVEERGSNTLAGDLRYNFEMPFFTNVSTPSKDIAMSIVNILMKHKVLAKKQVTDKMLSEIGVRTPSNGIVYGLLDYLPAFKNNYITECKKRIRLENNRRKNIL